MLGNNSGGKGPKRGPERRRRIVLDGRIDSGQYFASRGFAIDSHLDFSIIPLMDNNVTTIQFLARNY